MAEAHIPWEISDRAGQEGWGHLWRLFLRFGGFDSIVCAEKGHKKPQHRKTKGRSVMAFECFLSTEAKVQGRLVAGVIERREGGRTWVAREQPEQVTKEYIDICRHTETSADAIMIREKGYEFEGEQGRLLRFVGEGEGKGGVL